ncbi:unnamed protein product [Triticum turgidum subsp. durum]|uniref:Alpha/beta hydrolase fold-3 domain-containing protein n=1 Tax=Triticum turgidum subsp. durum TaxID=4567 RepID=A0A9R0TR73_TRITD|nr:unnamed protein product [Triticum turgidum subsp. durum]
MPISAPESWRRLLWAALLVAPLAALLYQFPIQFPGAPYTKAVPAMDAGAELELEYDMPGVLRVHKSGRVERFDGVETVPPCPSGDPANGVASKDVVLDPAASIHARLYLPSAAAAAAEPGKKLPVVVFFHGGAFFVHTAASPLYHRYGGFERAWEVICSGRFGPDHPYINPAASPVEWRRLGSGRVLVTTAEHCWFVERARAYAEGIKACGWDGELQFHETKGEAHVYFLPKYDSDTAVKELAMVADFVRRC